MGKQLQRTQSVATAYTKLHIEERHLGIYTCHTHMLWKKKKIIFLIIIPLRTTFSINQSIKTNAKLFFLLTNT
jgi:hypothetical protein